VAQQREGKVILSEGGILEGKRPRSIVAFIDRINKSHVRTITLAGAAPPRVRNQSQSSIEEALVHA
jgi:hypothetical protein